MDKQSRRATHRARLLTAAAVAAGLLAACGGGGSGADAVGTEANGANAANAQAATLGAGTAVTLSKNSRSAKTVAQPQNTEGRLLASNCFQCHGTMGTGGFDSIRGKDADEVLEFMRKPASGNIMAAHAQGYTPAQLQKIIAYLQQ